MQRAMLAILALVAFSACQSLPNPGSTAGADLLGNNVTTPGVAGLAGFGAIGCPRAYNGAQGTASSLDIF